MTKSAVHLIARAKINLLLRVNGIRDDGYHEIETIMQAVELTDQLQMFLNPVTSVRFEGSPSPSSPDLVEKTIARAVQTIGGPGADVVVTKRIPIGAGLGGGSADAAAALLGFNDLRGRALPGERMLELAADLGSDVPFALVGGTAFSGGRGEQPEAIACAEKLWWVIAIPDFELSTRLVYEHFDSVGPAPNPPDAAGLGSALLAGDAAEVAAFLHNDLEPAAFDLRPELTDIKALLVDAGALGAVMSGSGSALCALCKDAKDAKALAATVDRDVFRVEVVSSAPRGAELLP